MVLMVIVFEEIIMVVIVVNLSGGRVELIFIRVVRRVDVFFG